METANILTFLLQRRQHQDNLIHTRLNWFITSQSFLFTAYAISQSSNNGSQRGFSLLLPLLGIVTSVTVYLSIIGGLMTFDALRVKLRALEDWRYLEVDRGRWNHWLWAGFLTAAVLPPIIPIAWICVLFWMGA